MGKYYPNVNPGEIVPGGFTYPNNAKLQGDFLYLRDANKNMVSGRQVDDGDSITVLDVGYSQQLALVQYPTSAGVRQGYVNNTPSVIKYNNANAWANGSTTEIVYGENGGQLGSLDPYEKATPLYKKDGMTHVVYNTGKGSNTKSGYVKYEGTGGGSTSSGGEIKPGELVPGGFTYPNNAKLQGDFLYLRDANKNMVSGRQVDNGDSITVLDVGYTKQLALVQYPTSAGVRQGYVNNTPSVIKYNDANAWANGSTTEIVYDENGGQLGSLSPYESATPLYKKNGMTHVVYNTDKGPNTKSGYVKYEGGSGFTDSNIQIPPISHLQAIKEQYGISGKGRPLNVYKIGNGSKVLFAGFALHGWEDNWDNDGLALVNIANSLITRLGDYKSQNNGLHGWTVYIAPCMNPDGVIVRGTKDGPGRCAVTSRIDMNRCFPYKFTPQYSSRNYTGANSLGAPEAKAIKSYLEKINSSSTEMIVLDFHGWMNFTQGNAEIGRYFGSQFGFGHNNGYSSGFFSSWASTLKNTKAVLIEYPTSTHSYSDVITGNYIGKTFNGIINVLKNNPGVSGGGSTGSEETPMAKSGKVINVTSNLNVRSDSSTSSNIIGSLAASAFVTIVAKKENFYKICYGTGFGYVSKDYIQIVDDNTLTFDEIRIIQEDLKRLGIFSGAASGYYDSLTEFAVREFQLRYNIIPANGVANEETRNAIKKALTIDVSNLNQYKTRNQWRAKDFDLKNGEPEYVNPDDYDTIAIHHSERSAEESITDLQNYFQNKKGYIDIGYHYVIAGDGTIYEGRPINVKGSHIEKNNTGKIGIVLIGNFHDGEGLLGNFHDLVNWAKGEKHIAPSKEQIDSLVDLIKVLKIKFHIKKVGGHRDFALQESPSECPGNIAYEILKNKRILQL